MKHKTSKRSQYCSIPRLIWPVIELIGLISLCWSASSIPSSAATLGDLCPRRGGGHEEWVNTMRCVVDEAKKGNARAAGLVGSDYELNEMRGNDELAKMGLSPRDVPYPSVEAVKADRKQAL